MARMRIPFHEAWIDEEEAAAAAAAVRANGFGGDGAICRRVERRLEDLFGARHALLTTSCTHALELALLCLDTGQEDEVILPSFTFSSTANCVVLRGGRPVFAEIRPETLTLDPVEVQRKITPRTKAIIPVHYAGVGCDMAAIMAIARAHRLRVVEDAAQAVDAKYQGRFLGTIGHAGCFSFHFTKNITCGEGGALLTDDDELARKAEILREKGTNRAAFLRGEVDKYTWILPGSSYVLSDLLAAVLEVQLKKKDGIRSRRRAIWEAYYEGLRDLAPHEISLPTIPTGCESNYHIFFFRARSATRRSAILAGLRAKGIEAAFHYVPLHSAPEGLRWGGTDSLPLTTEASEGLVRLPLYPGLTNEAVIHIIAETRHAVLATREAAAPPAPILPVR